MRFAIVGVALMVAVSGCGETASDGAGAPPSTVQSSAGSSTTTATPPTTSIGVDFAGGTDGPVMFAPGPPADGGEDALIQGVLVRDGDCLFVGDGAPGARIAVLWPFGTSWDADADEVVAPDGTRIPVGSVFSAGGGYGSPELLLRSAAGGPLAERAEACVEGDYRELAHVQHSISVTGPGSLAGEPGGENGSPDVGWQRLPDAPLSARSAAILADLDGRIVVAGGWDLLCPPAADCVLDDVSRFVDGASLRPGREPMGSDR